MLIRGRAPGNEEIEPGQVEIVSCGLAFFHTFFRFCVEERPLGRCLPQMFANMIVNRSQNDAKI